MRPGQGSIYQLADGRWVAQVSIGGRTARRYRKRICHTYRDARAALAALNDERDRGLNPSRATLSAYLAQWVAGVRNIRPASRRSYETAIAVHISPELGDIRLAQLQPIHVERLLSRLGEYLSPVTVRKVHGVLRTALSQAVRHRLLPYNVAAREFVDPPRIPSREPRALSGEEVHRLLQAAAGHRFETLIRVAVGTGMRSGELRGLAWEDVDLDGAVLHVRHSLRAAGGRYVRDELKTDRSRRRVPLSPTLVETLRAHRQALKAADFVPTATGPVFPNLRGGPLADATLDHEFHDLLARAGIPRAPFKILRATFSTRLFEAGVPDRRVADLLGHTRSRTTHQHYIGAGDDWAGAMRAVEEMVG